MTRMDDQRPTRSPLHSALRPTLRACITLTLVALCLAFPVQADSTAEPSIIPVAVPLSVLPASLAGRTIHAGGDWAYPPFEYLDEAGNPAGFNVDLARALTRVTGIPIEIELGPWAETRARLGRGELDALLGMFKSQERAGQVDFSIPHFVTVYRIFTRKGSAVKKVDDLGNAWIAVQNGDMGQEFLIEHGYAHRLISFSEWTDLFKALIRGEVDCVVSSTLQGWQAIQQKQFSSIVSLPEPLFTAEYCLAVRKGDAELLAAINEGLGILRTTGEYEVLYRTWFGKYDKETGGSMVGIIAITLSAAFTTTLAVIVWAVMIRNRAKKTDSELSLERIRHAECHKLLQKSNAETEALKAEAERGRLERSSFIFWLSKEFGEPLEHMGSLFDSVSGRYASPEGQTALETIRQSADRLCRRVSDLLEATGTGKEILQLRPAVFSFSALATGLETTLRTAAEKRGLAFRFSCSGDERPVLADAGRIEQVIQHLCGNAIMYTDKGEVELVLALGEDSLYISVKDTGPGLPEEVRRKVFTPYFKGNDSSASLGLGLGVVKSTVDAMGGSIRYETRPSIGTHFEVSLPVENAPGLGNIPGGPDGAAAAPGGQPPAAHKPATRTARPPGAPASLKRNEAPAEKTGGRVIIAEDEAINRLYLKRVLEAAGYEVHAAADGEAAMNAAATGHWDFVLMDVSMPRMDGLEATRRIRAAEAAGGLRRTPIIALTAHAYAEDREACAQAGMDGFLPKPFTEPALWAEVRKIVS